MVFRLTALGLLASGCVFITEGEYAQRMQRAGTAPGGDVPCVETAWFADADGDGLGDPAAQAQACEQPSGTVANGDDCDDTDAAILVGLEWYLDIDGDGYGDPDSVVIACTPPPGAVANGDDCDDENGGVYPGADEICDSAIDDDCDGETNDLDASGCTVFYEDADSDGHGGEASECRCTAAEPFVAEEPSDCDDGNAAVNPDVDEVCNNGIDDDCDGTPGTCGLLGDQPLSDSEAVLLGSVENGHAGSAVSGVGDVTGDGVADLMIGAYNADDAKGRVYLVPGPVSGEQDLDTFSSWVGEEASDKLGRDAGAVGDLNGDEVADLVMAAPQNSGGGYRRGKAYVMYGPIDSASDLLADADATILGTKDSALVGRNFDGVGDFDQDGSGDLLLGAIHHKFDGVDVGAAILVFGPIVGEVDLSDSAADALVLVGLDVSDATGVDVTGVGDLDGDGYDDIAIGARSAGGTGAVYIVRGYEAVAGTVDLSDADLLLTGDQSESKAGSVMGAGDADGDGAPDLAIAAPYWDDDDVAEGENVGTVYLVFDPVGDSGAATGSLPEVADVTVTGETVSGTLGEGLDLIADLDGDGRAELVVGVPVPGPPEGTGAVLVFYSPLAGVLTASDADAVLSGDLGDGAGTGLAGVGDVDGDGSAELLVGAPQAEVTFEGDGIVYLINGGGL